MSRWFRHYAGMVRDDKLVRVALKSKQSIERVVWIWGAVLESAAEIDSEARYEVDADEIAHFLRCKPAAVEAVLDALKELGRIDDTTIVTWSKRQFKTDKSTDRVKRYREARKSAGLLAQWQPSKELRQEVYAADNHQCVYCAATDDLTIDHKVPEMHGGTHDRSNLQTACRRCNAKKRDLTHDEFVARNAVTVPETGHRQRTETDIPLSNDNGRPPLDEDAQFWADAKAYLTRRGVKNPGAMVGKWCRDHGRTETASVITRAQLERPADLIPFIEGSFRRQSNNGYGPGHSGVPL